MNLKVAFLTVLMLATIVSCGVNKPDVTVMATGAETLPKHLSFDESFYVTADDTDRLVIRGIVQSIDIQLKGLVGDTRPDVSIENTSGGIVAVDGDIHAGSTDTGNVVYKVAADSGFGMFAENGGTGFANTKNIFLFAQPGQEMIHTVGFLKHLLGHYLGLEHSGNPQDVMFLRTVFDDSSPVIFSDGDIAQLCARYTCIQ